MSLLLARLSSVGCLVLTAAPRVGDQRRTHDSQSPKKKREESKSGPTQSGQQSCCYCSLPFSPSLSLLHILILPLSSSLHPFAPRLIFLKRHREKKISLFCGSWLVGSVAESLARSPPGDGRRRGNTKRTFKELQG